MNSEFLQISQKNMDFLGVNDVTPTEAHRFLGAKNITWIDVRSPEEYVGELAHINGSVLIPIEQMTSRTSEIDKQGVKIFVCRSGQRSAKACQYLQELGYTDCYNLAGGMIEWNRLQLPIEGK